ncbi:MAG: hypothetical protein N2C14_09150 [Planctomycetales bacterium]
MNDEDHAAEKEEPNAIPDSEWEVLVEEKKPSKDDARPVNLDPSKLMCFLLIFAGVFMPVVCFSLAFQQTWLDPEWQSGNLGDYAGLLLGGPPTWCFYPLLIYAMVCLCLVLWFDRYRQSFFVRLGVHGGVLVALQYAILVYLAWFGVSSGLDANLLWLPVSMAISVGVPLGTAFAVRALLMTALSSTANQPAHVQLGGAMAGITLIILLALYGGFPISALAAAPS